MNDSSSPSFQGSPLPTDSQLEAMRQVGDPLADALAAEIFTSGELRGKGGRLGYNRLVDLADVLEEDPELLLVEHSELAREFDAFPRGLRDYYRPMPAPAWVDAARLEQAAELWKQNSLAVLFVLYAASLPACYLIKNGIPALYQTAKLRDPKYVFQRIYETGLMLDAVMSPGGLRIVRDRVTDTGGLFREHLEQKFGGKWESRDGEFVRLESGGAEGPSADARELKSDYERRIRSERAYLWGKGYISAKKVRMLHASMRCMLLNPAILGSPKETALSGSMAERFRQAHGGWDRERLGVPVNQEDLAFTLLTFSYLIPKGLEKIGCELSLQQKEAFLHLWRVVGHIMGLRDELMTDRWEEAETLYNRIHRLQAGTSEDGVALTETVMGFLSAYLPPTLGLREYLPAALIAEQMGEDAKLLMSEKNRRQLDTLWSRFLVAASTGGVRLYYRQYQAFLAVFPFAKRLLGNLLFHASEELVASWRDEYARKPFYVPDSVDKWKLQRGVDDQFRAKLQAWRESLFLELFGALLGLAIFFGGILAALVGWFSLGWEVGAGALGVAALGIIRSFQALDFGLPRLFAKRPKPEGVRVFGK